MMRAASRESRKTGRSAGRRRAFPAARLACAWTLAFLGSLSCAFGWGKDGHRIVADLASRWLTDRTRTEVEDLLRGESLAEVSTWADAVRDEPAYRATAPWHYVNIPKDAEAYDEKRDCPKAGCVVSAIRKQAETLKDVQAPREQRVEALKFLVHFVGDVHQPLHAGLAEDRGGNEIVVDLLGERKNLHEVWDSDLVERAHRPWKAYADELSRRMTDDQRKAWNSPDPAQWATESHKLALSHAYAVGAEGALGEAYMDRARPVVEDRLTAAGVRLAALLNSIFDPRQEDGGEKKDKPKP
ncbi:MAG: S1/P1 nuclease [Phycisphaerales bacterium]|nr:S1/P1 nuclease [Phycisphaerales bacterium]